MPSAKYRSNFRTIRGVFSAVLLSVCASQIASAEVVTSIRPIGFIAAAITDGVTTTKVLLPDGASPHNYALRPSDVQQLRNAELVVWVGPEMEVFLDKPLQQVSAGKTLALSQVPAIDHMLLGNKEDEHSAHDSNDHQNHDDHQDHDGHDHNHDHGDLDMHIWLSPAIAKQIAIAIHDRLVEQQPENKAKLDVNLREFVQQLEQAEQNLGNMLASVQGRGYFVFHDAYRYFENYFGLTQLGHFTVNPEIQPGAQRLHQIRTQLVEQKAACVFAEPQFRPAVINAVAQGTNVRKGELDPLGSGIKLSKESYVQFLTQLSTQFASCLKDET